MLLSQINETCFSLGQCGAGVNAILFFKRSRETADSVAKPSGISVLNSILHLLNPGVVLDQARPWSYDVLLESMLGIQSVICDALFRHVHISTTNHSNGIRFFTYRYN